VSVYPIVKLPRKVQQAYAAAPQESLFDPPKLVDAVAPKPPRRFHSEMLAVESTLLSVVCGVIGFYGSWLPGVMLWLIGIALFAAQASRMDASYGQRWCNYREKTDRHLRQQWEAEFEKARWERLQTPDGIAQYRRQLISTLLLASDAAGANLDPLPSIYQRFANTLSQYFPRQVYLELGSGLMLIEAQSNLHISIMIDERPQKVAGIAAGSFIEDDLYLDRGWVLARFTVEQVANYPESCSKALAEILMELLQDSAWTNPFTETPDLWTLPSRIDDLVSVA
jgi:hypothetical protein